MKVDETTEVTENIGSADLPQDQSPESMEGDSRPELSSDLSGVVLKNSNLASSRSLKLTSTPSGKLTPRASALQSSPSFRRSSSFRAKRVESRGVIPLLSSRWVTALFSRRNIVPWLLLIGIWSYVVFLFQYRWVDAEGRGTFFGSKIQEDPDLRLQTFGHAGHVSSKIAYNASSGSTAHSESLGEASRHDAAVVQQAGSRNFTQKMGQLWPWGRRRRGIAKGRKLEEGKFSEDPKGRVTGESEKRGNGAENSARRLVHGQIKGLSSEFPMVVTGDPAQGRLVGPFDEFDLAVGGFPGKRKQHKCRRDGLFPQFVKDKNVVVVLHELSMTGAPLAMMELASEMISCKAKVSAVILNRKGGLLQELTDRGIRLVGDKEEKSWKAAAKADLVVAGSASCSSWIGKYLAANRMGGGRLIWWIMENRQEYFEKSKLLLREVSAVIFISESQAQLWKDWCNAERIKLPGAVGVVPLSINDDVATLAGVGQSDKLSGSLTIDIAEEMAEKRRKMRFQARRAMGLDPDDMLVISLSSINPGKGQYNLVLAALLVSEGMEYDGLEGLARLENSATRNPQESEGGGSRNEISRAVAKAGVRGLTATEHSGIDNSDSRGEEGNTGTENLSSREQNVYTQYFLKPNARMMRESETGKRKMKVLIGSLGSKSNKVPYVEKILGVITRHPKLADMIFWTKASVHVAPLYASADAYVMNAQGIGETFGRVTIEAMAFGLPVIGTDAGGTKEIVEQNVTGFLHPVGRAGVPILAQQLSYLRDRPRHGKEMGQKGKEKVNLLYREGPMYEKLAKMFILSEDGRSQSSNGAL